MNTMRSGRPIIEKKIVWATFSGGKAYVSHRSAKALTQQAPVACSEKEGGRKKKKKQPSVSVEKKKTNGKDGM